MTRFAYASSTSFALCMSLLPAACELKHQLDPGGDTDATTGTDTMTSDSASSTSMSSTSSDPGPGDGSATDGPGVEGPFVDCADLPAGGDTVAPGPPGVLGFPEQACDPRTSGSANGYRCCSTDPATADGQLPAYEGKGITGSTPLYADAANGAGRWGMCVDTTVIPDGSGLLADDAMNCPIPCNPTWDDLDIAKVCGVGRVCCQTIELGAKDCVQDDGVWRAVTGADIGDASVMPPTNWNNAAHDTHQDPNGVVCLAASGNDVSSPEFVQCIRTLSVADQRGFCMAFGPGQMCPADDPSYVDACEAMN
jgi:hypothetical protein